MCVCPYWPWYKGIIYSCSVATFYDFSLKYINIYITYNYEKFLFEHEVYCLVLYNGKWINEPMKKYLKWIAIYKMNCLYIFRLRYEIKLFVILYILKALVVWIFAPSLHLLHNFLWNLLPFTCRTNMTFNKRNKINMVFFN